MNLDDFDSEEIQLAPAPEIHIQTKEDIEAEQTAKIRQYRRAKELIISPEVATALREGWTQEEIAEVLGVSLDSVNRHIHTAEMQVLIDREARRVLQHLTGRSLGDEKYRDLALAMGVLIDKARVLRNEPTEIVRTETDSISRLEILLFGRQARGSASDRIIEITQEPGTGCDSQLPAVIECEGQDTGDQCSDSGDESGSSE
jgi:transcriptional regulator with XRE-family HTH domain